MNPRATILLAILAVILGAVAIYLVSYVPGGKDAGGAEKHLFDFKVQAIDKITVKRKGLVVYDLERDGSVWQFREPPLGDADSARVTLVLADLRFAVLKHDLSAGGEKVPLERYGLTPPKLEVVMKTSGKTLGIDLGNLNPTNDGVFARLHRDDHVVLTDVNVLKDFDVPAERFKGSATPAEGPVPAGR